MFLIYRWLLFKIFESIENSSSNAQSSCFQFPSPGKTSSNWCSRRCTWEEASFMFPLQTFGTNSLLCCSFDCHWNKDSRTMKILNIIFSSISFVFASTLSSRLDCEQCFLHFSRFLLLLLLFKRKNRFHSLLPSWMCVFVPVDALKHTRYGSYSRNVFASLRLAHIPTCTHTHVGLCFPRRMATKKWHSLTMFDTPEKCLLCFASRNFATGCLRTCRDMRRRIFTNVETMHFKGFLIGYWSMKCKVICVNVMCSNVL